MINFTLAKAKNALGEMPDNNDLDRLEYYYGKEGKEHRHAVFRAFFDGEEIESLLNLKLELLGLKKHELDKRSLNCHRVWIIRKARRMTIRILNIRLRLDEGLSKRRANQILRKRFDPNNRASDGGYSTMSKNTKSKLLDEDYQALPPDSKRA